MKSCSKCSQLKSFTDYHNDRSKKDGLGSCCKVCTKVRQAGIASSIKSFAISKTCTKCLLEKPSSAFGTDKYTVDGKTCRCRPCEKIWRVKNPDKIRNSVLKRVYGIDLNEYNRLLKNQQNKCILCTLIGDLGYNKDKSLAVDHDHTTGTVRGLLCSGHNTGLGYFGDNLQGIEIALNYLRGMYKL